MKKYLLLITIIAGVGALLWMNSTRTSLKSPSVAIVMTLSHPALESARAGFLSAIKPLGLLIKDYNAEGNVTQANLIAQQIAADDSIVGIFAIGTLAAQAVVRSESQRPIVIAAVSDPHAVADPLPNNVCGLSDGLDAHWQIKTIIKLLPQLSRLSLLYSPHEANSAAAVKNLTHEAKLAGLKPHTVGVHDAQSIMSASLDACQKSDAVLIPLDNQLVASMPAVIKATQSLPCAIITSNESPIHQGASIAFGVNYQQSGHDAGMIMDNIVHKKQQPSSIGIVPPKAVSLYINKAVQEHKKLHLGEDPDVPSIIIQGGQP